jgi:glucose/arabinose dehydrogenase
MNLGPWCLLVVGLTACSTSGNAARDAGSTDATTTSDGRSPLDGSRDVGPDRSLPIDVDARPPTGAFCSLPGSIVFTGSGPEVMPGDDAAVSAKMDWLTLPQGFCAHYYGQVPMARQLRFAPDGRLFVASPCCGTTGGGNDGRSAIVVMPDADQNGEADSVTQYLGGLPKTQGLLFTGGYLYFQGDPADAGSNGLSVMRVPFATGDVSPSGPVETVTTITAPQSPGHWPKMLDVAPDGTIYVTNGGDQGDPCLSTDPVRGAIFTVNADGSNSLVAKGFRNPIALRCETDHDTCYALELEYDFSNAAAGREKIVPVLPGSNWGYRCCATANTPYTGLTYQDTGGTPDCSDVSQEPVSFQIGETPFGIDYETGKWPAPWTYRAFVAMHGVFGSWTGARVLTVARAPGTGAILPATDLDGGESANMLDFALGWDDTHMDHGRPGSVTFAPDGRLFVGDDVEGVIFWVAPVDLMP